MPCRVGERRPGSAGQPATVSPCPCTVPTAAPDCARQNCRCQALHRKESGEGGRGGGTSAQQQGCEVQINLVLCWCRSEAPRPPARCGLTVTHTGLRAAAGPAAGRPSRCCWAGGQQVPRAVLGPGTGDEGAQWDPGADRAHCVPRVLQSVPSHLILRNGCSGLSFGSWVCSTQTCAPTQLLQMSKPKFLLFNFLLLILSLLVLHTSFPSSFLLAVFHLP